MKDDDEDGWDDDDGELVKTGAFVVDAAVAAEKLRDFQLADADDFLLPWLRAAVAAEARRVDARLAGGDLLFSFDGRAPDPAVLADLTAGLLHGDYGESAQHLAFGALAARRLRPASVTGAAREGGFTELRVSGLGADAGRRPLARLAQAYGMTAAELFVEGRRVPDPALAREPVKAFGGRATRVVVLETRSFLGRGRLRLYKLGALVEERDCALGGSYTAFAANDRFTLSLSQGTVLQDRRFKKLADRLARLRRRLARRDLPPATTWLGRLRRWING